MNFAAFFRNLNLGRANCPDRAEFEAAFLAAGATEAANFLTNGTLVYSARSEAAARRVLKGACEALRAGCGLREPAFLRPVGQLAELVASAPFAAVDRASVYECCVSFLPVGEALALPALPTLPLASRRGDVEVIGFTGGEALSLSRKLGNTPGSPNAFLEKLLGVPATTRAWNTVARLVAKHQPPPGNPLSRPRAPRSR